MKTLRVVTAVVLLVAGPWASAQSPLGPLQGFLDQACSVVHLEFACSLNGLVKQGTELYNTIYGEFDSLTRGFQQTITQGDFSVLAKYLPMADINRELGPLTTAIDDVGSAVDDKGAAVQKFLNEAHDAVAKFQNIGMQRFSTARAADDTMSYKYENLVGQSPSLQVLEVKALKQKGDQMMTGYKAEAASEMSKGIAESLSDNSAEEAAATAVLRQSVVPGFEEGTAEKLERKAAEAPSSRLVLQALSEGFADFMRQDAVFNTVQIETVKAIAQQGAMTNWQMSMQIQQQMQNAQDDVMTARDAAEAAFYRGYQEGSGEYRQVLAALQQVYTLGNVDVESLKK